MIMFLNGFFKHLSVGYPASLSLPLYSPRSSPSEVPFSCHPLPPSYCLCATVHYPEFPISLFPHSPLLLFWLLQVIHSHPKLWSWIHRWKKACGICFSGLHFLTLYTAFWFHPFIEWSPAFGNSPSAQLPRTLNSDSCSFLFCLSGMLNSQSHSSVISYLTKLVFWMSHQQAICLLSFA